MIDFKEGNEALTWRALLDMVDFPIGKPTISHYFFMLHGWNLRRRRRDFGGILRQLTENITYHPKYSSETTQEFATQAWRPTIPTGSCKGGVRCNFSMPTFSILNKPRSPNLEDVNPNPTKQKPSIRTWTLDTNSNHPSDRTWTATQSLLSKSTQTQDLQHYHEYILKKCFISMVHYQCWRGPSRPKPPRT